MLAFGVLRLPILAASGLIVVGLAGCGNQPLCSSKVLQTARDPGSDRYAVTELRDCGATTGYATIVRVGRSGEPQADATEVFVADSDHGAATADSNAIWTSLAWLSSGDLSITYASKARIFKKLAGAKGAAIALRPGEPPALQARDAEKPR
ncbi:MAG: hypothetical protein KF730_00145 [Sphingomonas sp.]|uniref:hypothetical protein n=1 Tax=Sphingomonas sp. TaxID=28214 RepID=UPI0025D89333|nr:hypothetical protein [Sphingomonas sp.]MBX3562962.1 hypothetical protein [Sphingomonas sp.]